MRARPSRRLPAPPCAQVRPPARWQSTHAQPHASPSPAFCALVSASQNSPSLPVGVGEDRRCLSRAPQLAHQAGLDATPADLLFCPGLRETQRQRL